MKDAPMLASKILYAMRGRTRARTTLNSVTVVYIIKMVIAI